MASTQIHCRLAAQLPGTEAALVFLELGGPILESEVPQQGPGAGRRGSEDEHPEAEGTLQIVHVGKVFWASHHVVPKRRRLDYPRCFIRGGRVLNFLFRFASISRVPLTAAGGVRTSGPLASPAPGRGTAAAHFTDGARAVRPGTSHLGAFSSCRSDVQ